MDRDSEEYRKLIQNHLSTVVEVQQNLVAVKGLEWAQTVACLTSMLIAVSSLCKMVAHAESEFIGMAEGMKDKHTDSVAFIVGRLHPGDPAKAKEMMQDVLTLYRHGAAGK